MLSLDSSDDTKGVSSKGPSIASIPKEGPSIPKVPKEGPSQELLDGYGYDSIEEYLEDTFFDSTDKDATNEDTIHESYSLKSKGCIFTCLCSKHFPCKLHLLCYKHLQLGFEVAFSLAFAASLCLAVSILLSSCNAIPHPRSRSHDTIKDFMSLQNQARAAIHMPQLVETVSSRGYIGVRREMVQPPVEFMQCRDGMWALHANCVEKKSKNWVCSSDLLWRDTVQLKTAVSTISQDYLLEFTSEYGISEALYLELPGPGERIVDFPEGKVSVYTKFFEFANSRLPLSQFLFDILGHYQIHMSQLSIIGAAKVSHFKINCCVLNIVPTLSLFCVFYIPSFHSGWMSFDERVFPTIVDWCTSAPKDEMLAENTYSSEAVMILNTHRTPIQKQPEALLCLVGLSRRYFLGDKVYPTFFHDNDWDMDLFNLIRAPNPTKVKTGTRPRAAHEVPLLTVTASRVIEMKDPAAETDSSGVPSNIERPSERDCCHGPHVIKERRKRGNNRVDTNAPPKVLRRDHADSRPTQSTHGGKSLAAIGLGMGSTRPVPASRGAHVDVSDPDPLSFADPQSRPTADLPSKSSKGTAVARDPESENTSFTFMVGSPKSIYRLEWGVTNGCLLDAPKACQDLVDHIAPPGYISELRHLHNDDFLKKYNVNLARKVAMRSQLRLRFEQEATLLKKFVAQVAHRDKRIQAMENEIKNLETLLEAGTDMKKAAEGKREEKLKAAFEEFKQYEDNRVEQRCAEMDARLDALSIDFDEELYPHMLTAIVGRRWVIGHVLRLAVMKCGESTELRQAFVNVVSVGIAKGMSEGLKHGVEHGKANLSLEAIEAYDLEAEAKYIAALHALKDLKYPIVDQLESLKDVLMDVIMSSLHLEKARDPTDPWACKEEILLADAIVANVSRAEKKKKCRVVCRTHGIGFAHHSRSDSVPVFVPTVAPQGLAILLADAATQTEISEDRASLKLLRSSSLPVMYN
nr:hypothetical protein [Tanacetum cinerariifolium]